MKVAAMKYLLLLLFVLLFPSLAQATIDPDPDQIGVYFDLEAETSCIDADVNVPFDAYIIITNPTSEVSAFAFSLCLDVQPGMEVLIFRLSHGWPVECGIDIHPVIYDECEGGIIRGCSEPLPAGPGGMVVLTEQYMLLADMLVEFRLGPTYAYDSAGSIVETPPYYAGPDEEIIPLGISSGDPALPVAQVNGDCRVVPVENATFGRVKGLYR